jgi:hypothetical protein
MYTRGSRAALVALGLFAGATGGVVAACATSGGGAQPPGADASPDASMMQMKDSSGGGGNCDGANLQTDYANCGKCGNVCPTTQICNQGQCQANCTTPEQLCPGKTGCYNLTNDLQNCGACGAQCTAPEGTVTGNAVCANGFCDFTCPDDAGTDSGAPIVKCAADAGTAGCFDLTTSPQACGSCSMACTTGDTCTSGQCCTSGSIICGGTCTDIQTSATNCGSCEAGCPSPAQCVSGQCTGYVVTNPTVPFINACSLPGEKAVMPNTEFWTIDPAGVIPLPFPFTFFGTTETEFWIGSQGTIGFGALSSFDPPDSFPTCVAGQSDPSEKVPAAVIFGDPNLATGPDGVCYATLGAVSDAGADAGADAGPGAQFVITWAGAYDTLDTGSQMTFSIVLTQGTNTIDFMYDVAAGPDGGLDTTVSGATATVGIQLPTSTSLEFAKVSCDTTFIPSMPYDVRFAAQ